MATHSLTYKFGNNFENEASSGAVSVPAQIQGEGARGAVPPVFIGAGDTVTAFTIPANCIIKSFYLVVEDAMVGLGADTSTVTVTLDDTATTVLFQDADIFTTGEVAKSTVEDLYVTTPYTVSLTFLEAQTEGAIKLVYDFIQLDTNTAKYINR